MACLDFRLNGLDAKFDDLAKLFDEFLEIVVQEHMDEFRGLTKNEDQKDLVDVLLCLQADSPIDRVSIKAIIVVINSFSLCLSVCYMLSSVTLCLLCDHILLEIKLVLACHETQRKRCFGHS